MKKFAGPLVDIPRKLEELATMASMAVKMQLDGESYLGLGTLGEVKDHEFKIQFEPLVRYAGMNGERYVVIPESYLGKYSFGPFTAGNIGRDDYPGYWTVTIEEGHLLLSDNPDEIKAIAAILEDNKPTP